MHKLLGFSHTQKNIRKAIVLFTKSTYAMNSRQLHVKGAVVLQGNSFEDERGNFRELFHRDKYPKILDILPLPQVISYFMCSLIKRIILG